MSNLRSDPGEIFKNLTSAQSNHTVAPNLAATQLGHEAQFFNHSGAII